MVLRVFLFAWVWCVGNLAVAQGNDHDADMQDPVTRISLAMNAHRFRDAEQQCRQLLAIEPNSITYKHLLCHALIGAKDFAQSDSLLNKLLESDTNNAGTYWYMGLSAERQNKNELAVFRFKQYLRKTTPGKNQNLSAWLHVGSAYRRIMHSKGIDEAQWADLLYHYQTYLQSQPTDPMAENLQVFVDKLLTKRPAPGQLLRWDEP